jgi:hypothetical protein
MLLPFVNGLLRSKRLAECICVVEIGGEGNRAPDGSVSHPDPKKTVPSFVHGVTVRSRRNQSLETNSRWRDALSCFSLFILRLRFRSSN